MGISGNTAVKCISQIVNEYGELVLATKDDQIYRYSRMKEKFELISDIELHDGSEIKEVDELCV